MNRQTQLISDTIDTFPEHYHETFSDDFLLLLALLRLHRFTVVRADEAVDVGDSVDLWKELAHPSVWLQSKEAPQLLVKLRQEKPGSEDFTRQQNALIRSNLAEQRRMLALLDEFYEHHNAPAHVRLAIENIDHGDFYLRPQGVAVRLLLDESSQDQWLADMNRELLTFAKFLADKLE